MVYFRQTSTTMLAAFDMVISAPFGKIAITLTGGAVSRIQILQHNVAVRVPADTFCKQVAAEFQGYFSNADWRFSVPLKPLVTTNYRRRIWKALTGIRPGRVKTYGQLAREFGGGARGYPNRRCRIPHSDSAT